MPFCLLRDPAVFYHCSDAWTGIQQDREQEEKKRELIALLHLILSLLSTQASHPPPLPLDRLLAKPPQADEDRILDSIDRAHPSQTFNRRNPGHTPLPPPPTP